MCGRAACTLAPEEIQKQTHAKAFEGAEEYKPSYNIAPHQMHVAMLLDADGQPILKLMRWGLVPSWSKDGTVKMHTINARAESLTTNNLWRGVVKRKRCIILVSGYFEWITEKGQKIPFYIHSDDPQQLLYLAGMYDVWTDPKTGEKRYTCTVVTTESSPQLAHIHDRMPVILGSEEAREMWLRADGNDPSSEVLRLLRPYKGEHVVFDKVSTMVNSIKNNSPECLVPVDRLASKKHGILTFFNPTVKAEKVKAKKAGEPGPDATTKDEKKKVKTEPMDEEQKNIKIEPKNEEEEEEQEEVEEKEEKKRGVKQEPKEEDEDEEQEEVEDIDDDEEEDTQGGKRRKQQPPARIAKRKRRRTDAK
ncbi:uncharacterized protein ACA1_325220 [Acanthamoeba castellanii str. Neff]|uniref:Uncharacterized protein n=1 Tax=Acanthamoeba castellanii (strain ATCC 30010 / Neff) TaxID=1257118 RepID=L8GRZ1_ACACF|nr:uncharacterized protein ACA1_325220 [Acanthamoeba castellanii str. Neff]ELR14906.1 hypothetical protein ACA1_325220 [Acanthamoeba castellanii str. Neff]